MTEESDQEEIFSPGTVPAEIKTESDKEKDMIEIGPADESVLSSDDSSLPRSNHGFNMSVQTTVRGESSEADSKREPSTDSESDSSIPSIDKLPEEIQDWPPVLAAAHPHTSLLVVYLDPSQAEHLRFFQTFGLAEEMMHGRRHKFGLSRSLHLLKLESYAALRRFLTGSESIEMLAAILVKNELIINRIHSQREPLLEAIDKYLCYSVMGEEGYLDQHIEEFREIRDDLSYEEAKDKFTQTRRWLYEETPESLEEDDEKKELYNYVFDKLEEIEETYNRQVAETVADAALDIPYLIEPLQLSGYQTVDYENIDLIERFDAAIAALKEIDIEIDDIDPNQLRTRIETELVDPNENDDDYRHPRELALPLLDIPQTAEPDEAIRNKYEVILEAPTEMGQILNAAFRFTGNFGGAVYLMERPDGENATNWKVNPLIADEEIDHDAILPGSNPFGANTYEELWEYTYVYDHIIQQLVTQQGQKEVLPLVCPLCEIATEGNCHPEGCPVKPILEPINEKLGDIMYRINVESDARTESS